VIASLRDTDNNTNDFTISNVSFINDFLITVDSSNDINSITTIITTIITTTSSNDINDLTTTISGSSNSDQQVSTSLSEQDCHALLI
jgi:hypothetical protein